MTAPRIPKEPLTPTSRAQQFPEAAQVVEQIQNDPKYLERINELGGGRVVTNKETLANAAAQGALHPDEIANWEAKKPVDAVTAARAAMTMDWHEQGFVRAINEGDEAAATSHEQMLSHMLPGYNNLTAEPGRATQIQATFATDKLTKAFRELQELKNRGIPFDQIQIRAREILTRIRIDDTLIATGARLTNMMNAVETYATWAKLTSPMTHAFNTVSNAMTFLGIRPLEKAGKAVAQLAQGNPEGAAATVRYTFGTANGFVSGARKYLSELMADVPEGVGKSEVRPIGWQAPRWTRPVNPFRQLGAADAFWKTIIQDSHLHTMALESGLKEGLNGPALAQRVTNLVNNPPAPWLKRAMEEAKEVTFQSDPDVVLQKISGLQRVPGMRLIIPFVKTPYNIAKYQFERSPLGILMPRNIAGLARGGEQQADALGRLAAGTALAVSAWMLVKRGDVTGAMPTDPKEQLRWRAENLVPYSIRIGDKRITYNRFSPLGMYLNQAAAVEDALKSGGSVPQAFEQLAFQSVKGLMDMPFLQSTKELLDAISDPGRSGQKFIGTVATGFVPNILRDVRYQTDSTRRDARGIVPSLKNAIPGLSQGLPEQVDVLGRTAKYEPNRLARASKFISTPTETPETQAMDAIGFNPYAPSPTFKIGKETVKLSRQEESEFDKEWGAEGNQSIRNTVSNPGYQEADAEEKLRQMREAWDRAITRVRQRWKSKLRSKRN